MKSRSKKQRNAFSLIELMVVIIILGLLASLVVPNLVGKSDEAKVKLVGIQMKQLEEALKMFRLDMSRYPSTQEGLKVLIKKPEGVSGYDNYASSGYLGSGSVPKDPWGYSYIYVGEGNSYDIISLGSDGKEGGEDDATDIRLSDLNK